ncbi:MAG: hypothetical protein KJ725_00560 [Gammaproteobacteria bacterium]|jgi:hypothetical protein|uniref:hypothetical protein n=1 Tax=Methylotuvimicrobium sp. TaxID=2822413 RepID=UPI001D580431|nr:hypothetical protein [Gammaproteobacteria bacterium]
MNTDQRGFQIAMTQKLLNVANIHVGLKQLIGEVVVRGMYQRALGNAVFVHC